MSVVGPYDYSNPRNRFDVDGNAAGTALDALKGPNEISRLNRERASSEGEAIAVPLQTLQGSNDLRLANDGESVPDSGNLADRASGLGQSSTGDTAGGSLVNVVGSDDGLVAQEDREIDSLALIDEAFADPLLLGR